MDRGARRREGEETEEGEGGGKGADLEIDIGMAHRRDEAHRRWHEGIGFWDADVEFPEAICFVLACILSHSLSETPFPITSPPFPPKLPSSSSKAPHLPS